jgi:hypothetical protein
MFTRTYYASNLTLALPILSTYKDVLAITGYEVKEGSDYALKSKQKKLPKFSKTELKAMYPKYNAKVVSSLAIVDESVVNYELVAALLKHITMNEGEGAILVFMPGMMEITKTIEELYKNELFKDESQTVIYPLHSSLSTAEQTAIFQVPPKGVRKVVVATNIAETSITIEGEFLFGQIISTTLFQIKCVCLTYTRPYHLIDRCGFRC